MSAVHPRDQGMIAVDYGYTPDGVPWVKWRKPPPCRCGHDAHEHSADPGVGCTAWACLCLEVPSEVLALALADLTAW